MSSPFRILFVCTANICRSPFLELYATRELGSAGVSFSSAGTHGFLDHAMSDEMGVEATTNWGLDVSGFRSRRLTGELVDEADLVLTAERRHRQFILDDHAHAFGKVLTLGQAVRAASVAAPSEDVDGLLAELARHRGMAEAVRRHCRPVPPGRRGPVRRGRADECDAGCLAPVARTARPHTG